MRLFFSALFLFFNCFLFAQSGFNVTFDSAVYARTIDSLPGGNFLVMGINGGGYTNSILFKLDQNGDTIWTKRYGNDTIQYKSYDLSPLRDGGFVICGDYQRVSTQPNMDSYVMKVDSLGNVVWFNKYGKTIAQGGSKDFANNCRELENGKIVTGGWAKTIYVDTGFMYYAFFQGYLSTFDSAGNNLENRSLIWYYQPADSFYSNYTNYDYYLLDVETIHNKVFALFDYNHLYWEIAGFDENLDTLFTVIPDSTVHLKGISVDGNQLLVYGDNYLAELDTNGQIVWQTHPNIFHPEEALRSANGEIKILSGFDNWEKQKEAGVLMLQACHGLRLNTCSASGSLVSVDSFYVNQWDIASFDFVLTPDTSEAFAGTFLYKAWVFKPDSSGAIPATVNPENSAATFNVFPNPANDFVWLNGSRTGDVIEIFSADGKLIRRMQANDEETIIDLAGVEQGFYFVKLIEERGTATFRLVRE